MVDLSSIQIADHLIVRWVDGSEHAAEVVELRAAASGSRELYVHYLGYDRRLDEWIVEGRVKSVEQRKEGKKKDGKRKFDEISASEKDAGGHGHSGGGHGHHGSTDPAAMAYEKEHEEITKVKNITSIEIGRYEVDTWYYSPYPEEYCKDKKLYICEFCLKYMKKRKTLQRHKVKCNLRHPPGIEIYRKGEISVFEVDGKKHKIYCQNLCLLSKLFLDHKTLYYDVDPFLFYVVCEVDDKGCHSVGYFSKEKVSPLEFNLACILTFPPFQRKGYGKFMISLSYELSKVEKKVGSPEKPLSDLGKISYRSYWSYVLLNLIKNHRSSLSIKEMSTMTSFKPEDIISTLQYLNLIKYWKGQHIISVTQEALQKHVEACKTPSNLCDPSGLHWTPPDLSDDETVLPDKK